MQAYLLIALGSALGGMARFWCTGLASRLLGDGFPWGTLAVNVLGSLVIGLLATLAGPDGRTLLGTAGRQLLLVGICGGYTTFSAFSLQTLELMAGGLWLRAGANVLLSVVLCLVAVWLGHLLATLVNGVRWA